MNMWALCMNAYAFVMEPGSVRLYLLELKNEIYFGMWDKHLEYDRYWFSRGVVYVKILNLKFAHPKMARKYFSNQCLFTNNLSAIFSLHISIEWGRLWHIINDIAWAHYNFIMKCTVWFDCFVFLKYFRKSMREKQIFWV